MSQTQENGPGRNARAVNQENSHVAGSSLPPSRIPVARIIRTTPNRSFPGANLVVVACPYCGHEHTHGGLGNSVTGHRVAHCAPPAGTFYRKQRLEHQQAEHEQAINRLVDAYAHEEITFEQLENRIKAPLERMQEATAKLEAIDARYPQGKSYYISRDPASPTTREPGPGQ